MISSKYISIVVQGPVLTQAIYGLTNHLTQTVCKRLKKIFPESELILSTWEGQNVENIPYDKVIFNQDPGATWFIYNNFEHFNNCNRLIVSTFAGIKAASRPYVLKVRSDLFLMSKRFLKYFDAYPLYNDEYKFVKQRIIAFSLNSLNGHKTSLFSMQRPYHISDWAYFGHKGDLLNLYDIPLADEPEFSQWFLTRFKPFQDIEPERLWRMPPEQYVTYSFLKKHINIHLEHTADVSNNNVECSKQLLVNNFLVLNQSQFFLISLKYLYFSFSSSKGYESYIFHHGWLKNYYRYMNIPTSLKKIKIKLQIRLKSLTHPVVNKGLRILNGKTHRICRLFGYFIKIII